MNNYIHTLFTGFYIGVMTILAIQSIIHAHKSKEALKDMERQLVDIDALNQAAKALQQKLDEDRKKIFDETFKEAKP